MAIINPIKPEEILKEKAKTIPDAMIQAVNELLATNWNGSESRIRRDELFEKYFKITGEANDRHAHETLYHFHWLDFEPVFREAGWNVKYYHPSYGDEDYEPFYLFKINNEKDL